MSDKDLASALLKLDALDLGGPADVRQQTWTVLECDRRRVRRLTILSIILWSMAALMIFLVFIGFGLLFPMQAHIQRELEAGKIDKELHERMQFKSQATAQMITLLIAAAVGVLGLAALATVFLVLASRRATLRQVNARLIEISEQLQKLQSPPQKPPSSAVGDT